MYDFGDIAPTVRGIIDDRLAESGSPAPKFSDEEILTAIDATVGDLWGRSPDAFFEEEIITEQPKPLSLSKSIYNKGIVLETGKGSIKLNDTLNVSNLRDNNGFEVDAIITFVPEVTEHNVFALRCSGGTYAYFNFNSETEELTSGGALDSQSFKLTKTDILTNEYKVRINMSNGATVLTFKVFDGDSDTQVGTNLTMLASNLEPSTNPLAGLPLGLNPIIGGFIIRQCDFGDYSTLIPPYGFKFINQEIVFPEDFPVILDNAIPLQGWAFQRFCYGTASFLLRQRGKDSYYRKAADSIYKIYMEMR